MLYKIEDLQSHRRVRRQDRAILGSMGDSKPARSSYAWRGQSKAVSTRGLLREGLLWGIMWKTGREAWSEEIEYNLGPVEGSYEPRQKKLDCLGRELTRGDPTRRRVSSEGVPR